MRLLLILGLASICVPAWAAMPIAEENELVKRYCAVCHTDAAKNGGLSLEHYDAARRDPALALMILSKLNNGAKGAAGNGVPDKAAQEAWLDSTREQAGAKDWFVNREGGVTSASIVREVEPRKPGSTDIPEYRVIVACNPSTRVGEIQLTWSPEPPAGRAMTASVDGTAPVEYKIDGKESMGNGGKAQAGQASVVLSGKDATLSLENQSLTIRNLFPNETVEFPFADLERKTRSELRRAFRFSLNGRPSDYIPSTG